MVTDYDSMMSIEILDAKQLLLICHPFSCIDGTVIRQWLVFI